jgi:hypothetical protein
MNTMNVMLLNFTSILVFNDEPPAPDLGPLRRAIPCNTAELDTPEGRIQVDFLDHCGAGHFQITLDGDLAAEFIVSPNAGNAAAWHWFLDRFHQRIASGLCRQEGIEPFAPSWEPWIALFFTDNALTLPQESLLQVRTAMQALAHWYLQLEAALVQNSRLR